MPRLIWVFAGCTVTLFVLSCCSSNVFLLIKVMSENAANWPYFQQEVRFPLFTEFYLNIITTCLQLWFWCIFYAFWLKNTLYGLVVVVNGSSDWAQVSSCIPQGSVLGPVLFFLFFLFLIYIKDLPDLVHNILKLFADDAKLFGKS